MDPNWLRGVCVSQILAHRDWFRDGCVTQSESVRHWVVFAVVVKSFFLLLWEAQEEILCAAGCSSCPQLPVILQWRGKILPKEARTEETRLRNTEWRWLCPPWPGNSKSQSTSCIVSAMLICIFCRCYSQIFPKRTRTVVGSEERKERTSFSVPL